MSELETIIKEYEDKLFKIFKRNIDAKVIECKANNYDPIKTYIEIRKLINELEEDVKMYTGLNQMNDELDTRVIMYTDEYMEEAIADFKHRAEQLSEKFEKYIYLYEKQTEGKLEEGVIFRAYSNELKWIVQECMYLVRKKAKTNYYEELKIKENKGDK